MKYIFFLIPLLFSIPVAFADYRGEDYLDVTNPDGVHTLTIGLTPYIQNSNGQYVPYLYENNKVQTNQGSVILNSDGSYSFYKNDTPLFTDKIVAKYADMSNLNSWTYPNSINNDTPEITWDGTSFTSSKTAAIGVLDYKYVLNNGKWKTQLEATNLSAFTDKAFGFDQIVDLNTDTISFGGVQRNLDQYNGTTFNKTFLDNNKGKVLNFLNGIEFDFDLGYANLYSVTVYDTGVNSSRLVFDYRTNTPLLPNEKLVIDPTFGYTTSTIRTITDTGCNGSADATGTSGLVGANSGPTTCYFSGYYWDITTIPDTGIVISNVIVRLDQVGAASVTASCPVKSIEGNISTMTDQQVEDDIKYGTLFTTLTTECRTPNTNDYTISTASMAADLLAELAIDNEWGIGINGTNYVNVELGQFTGVELQVNYTTGTTPDAITDLNYTNLSISSLDLLWSQPSLNNGTLVNYLVNYTTPFGDPQTFLANSTNTYYNVTGLVFGTDYSFRVTALTDFGRNATGNILNVTTTAGTDYSSLAPTNLIVYTNRTTGTSQLNLEWVAPLMDNLNGYRIEREAPVGGGYSTIVSNTTSTLAYYNNTGLVVNTYYNYRVYGLNSTGITGASNSYSQTTYHLSDAVTTLSVTMTDVLSAILTWVQPVTLYGYLTGYQINYTTPTGDPQTVYLESTGSSAVTYTVTGLTSGETYSFRVSPITIHGKNTTFATIANGTAFSNFDIGTIYLPTSDNPVSVPIEFDLITINSTASDLQVTYDSSYNLACDFSYPISQSNTTYSGLTETAISGSSVYSNFTLNGYGDELIDVYCWDTLDNSTNGRERLGTTSIPLVGQVNSFQTGAFGTSGMFGAIDLLTLIVVIVSMIGFNRTHPIVGVAFMAVFIGAMTYYGVIAEQTTYLGAIALCVALAIIYGKRDDAE